MKDMLTATFTPVDVSDTEFLEKSKKEMNYLFACGLRTGFALKRSGPTISVYRNALFGRVLIHLHYYMKKLYMRNYSFVA